MGFIWVDDKDDDKKFVSHIETITKSLETSKTELQKDLKKLKKKVSEKEGFEIDEFNQMKIENEKLKKKREKGESDLEKQMRIMKEQHETDSKEWKDKIKILDNSNKTLLVDDELTKGLIVAKVKPALMNAAIRIIKTDVSVVDKDGKRIARIGDKKISEYIPEWAKTDEGKNFVLAKKNSGGDANGGEGEESETDYDKFFDPKSKQKNITKQVLLKKKDPELYNQLKSKYSK